MPTTYAHDLFGKEVYQKLPKDIKNVIKSAKSLYLTGLHGPDILFYYKPFQNNKVNQMGVSIHHENADAFFRQAVLQYRKEPSPQLASYILGFGCHYILDSTCHPYVWSYVEESGVSHAEIETEMDRYLMLREKKDPFYYYPLSGICQTPAGNRAIASVLPGITAKEVGKCLDGMKFYVKLLICQTPVKRNLLLSTMKLLGCYDSMEGQIFRENGNPLCQVSTKKLVCLYEEAREEAVCALCNLYDFMMGKGVLSERFSRNFE